MATAGTHLMIPFAAGGSAASRALLATLALPNLQTLLARLAPRRTIETPPDSPAMPHELALAAELGLSQTPGRTPWAAHDSGTVGVPCAFVHLCHWQAGMDQVQVLDPAVLALTDAESHALLASARPWFAEDGIELSRWRPGVWLARGELFREFVAISLDRVVGRAVSRELLQQSAGAATGSLPRLQNELQMLFYDHPVTDARIERRALYPNAIWITGAGVLSHAVPKRPALRVERGLARAALQDDADAFAHAWHELDSGPVAGLIDDLQNAQLTLCGEQRAITFAAARPGNFGARLARRLFRARPSPQSILAGL